MSSQTKRCVLVVGLDRSGTSATARVLNRLGVRMHNPLSEAHAHPSENPTGYYEDPAINKALDKQVFDTAVREVIQSHEYDLLWGLKDPRLAWPFNLDGVMWALKTYDPTREVSIVEVIRDPDAIAASRIACGGKGDEDYIAHLAKLKRNKTNYYEDRGLQVIRIKYDKLIEFTMGTVSRLHTWLNYSTVAHAAMAVKPELRHFE